jgi:multiple sugar transport system permease protein
MDIYQNAFQDLKLGYASAETVIMMLVIAIFIGFGRLLQKADAND